MDFFSCLADAHSSTYAAWVNKMALAPEVVPAVGETVSIEAVCIGCGEVVGSSGPRGSLPLGDTGIYVMIFNWVTSCLYIIAISIHTEREL